MDVHQGSDTVFQILTSATVGGFAALLVVWVARLWLSERIKAAIKNEYDEKLETHKAQLKAQSEVEIERLRSKLNSAALEHEIRFARLHEMRANAISETYSCLKELFARLADYVKPFEPAGGSTREERFKRLVTSYGKFVESYSKKLIYFPKDTANKLEEIDKSCSDAGLEFRDLVEPQYIADRTSRWIEIHKRVSTDIDTALRELETEFRRLLGEDN